MLLLNRRRTVLLPDKFLFLRILLQRYSHSINVIYYMRVKFITYKYLLLQLLRCFNFNIFRKNAIFKNDWRLHCEQYQNFRKNCWTLTVTLLDVLNILRYPLHTQNGWMSQNCCHNCDGIEHVSFSLFVKKLTIKV